MTEAEFYSLVRRMREHQRRYSRTRDPFVLVTAIDLEIAVDRAIREAYDGKKRD